MSASAETFPIFADTAGSPISKTIGKTAGRAITLPVSAKSTAFIHFAVNGSGIAPDSVTAARLVIYFPKVTTPGTLSLNVNGTGFTEIFTTKTIPTPTVASTVSTFPVTVALSKNFFILDVTTEVVSWLNGSVPEFGFGIASDGTANLAIGAKEGPGSGYPAVLEIDVNSTGGPIAGTNASFTGSVGIGTAAPNVRLQVVGSGGTRANVQDSGNGFAGYLQTNSLHQYFTGLQGDRWSLFDNTNQDERLSVLANGNIGVGTTTPGFNLDVASPFDTQIAIRSTSTDGRVYTVQSSDGGAVSGDGAFQIIDRTAGAARLMISKDGNLGIGTSTSSPPTATLDVRGNIKFGSNAEVFAAGAQENLRVVRGHVRGTGSIGALEGAGFTVARVTGQPTGVYRVSFTTPFSDVCSVTATPYNPAGTLQFATLSGYGLSFVDVRIWSAAGALVDSDFMFIATAPR
ncbi:MAG: hypothetical protein V4710_21280 [Verrucomicrobiota bacterium]